MRLALYQPDIPQNTGAILRLCACLGVAVDLIEPFGFVWDDRHLKRAGMDYLDQVALTRHRSWEAFQTAPNAGRLILLTTHGTIAYQHFAFRADDTLLFGRESAGVPETVHQAADARLAVRCAPGSLDQCRDDRRHGIGRSVAADRSASGGAPWRAVKTMGSEEQ